MSDFLFGQTNSTTVLRILHGPQKIAREKTKQAYKTLQWVLPWVKVGTPEVQVSTNLGISGIRWSHNGGHWSFVIWCMASVIILKPLETLGSMASL